MLREFERYEIQFLDMFLGSLIVVFKLLGRRSFENCLGLNWLSFVFKVVCGTLRSVWWLL